MTPPGNDEPIHILALDDDLDILRPIGRLLARRGFEMTPFTTSGETLAALRAAPRAYDVLLLDRFLGQGEDGLDVLLQARKIAPELPVVMLSGDESGVTAQAALAAGAFHFLSKPSLDIEVVSLTLTRAAHYGRLQRRARALEEQVALSDQFEHMVGHSRAMREVFATVAKVAEADVSVLVEGESGTGKELAARAIHARSPRARGPFVAINCGAIPENLIDSELFGHARGAFTGAVEARAGAFVEANGGTVFLDEIGEIPLGVQQRLLRVLQEHEVRPVGGTGARKVDVRVIAATHVDLEQLVADAQFRADLFYRLNVVAVRMPPLRERMDDLPLITAHLIDKHAARMRRPPPRVSPAAMEALARYPWPGNVRELENVIQGVLALSAEVEIGPDALPPRITQREAPGGEGAPPAPSGDLHTDLAWVDQISYKDARERAIGSFERRYFERLLRRAEGNVSEAARLAGLDRSNLRRMLSRHGIRAEDWRGSGGGH
ncbi:MAG TPA: sigma-54 dependent transcriptional regulator [Kofleriaceae bacterium]|nr:sigma-54 dependent transcriptional regulator [Kofleriaceae bacterium]